MARKFVSDEMCSKIEELLPAMRDRAHEEGREEANAEWEELTFQIDMLAPKNHLLFTVWALEDDRESFAEFTLDEIVKDKAETYFSQVAILQEPEYDESMVAEATLFAEAFERAAKTFRDIAKRAAVK